jgi:ribosomal-protein-serine acetyltransferase
MSSPFPLSADDDIVLDLLDEAQAEELFALVDANRAYLREWLPWLDQNTEVEHTRAFIRAARKRHEDRDGFTCGIRFGGALAGVVGLDGIDWANKRTSIGYWLAQAHQGRGIMTRACGALLPHLFGELGMNRVEIACAPGNARSAAIPERLGFTREGLLRQRERVYDRYFDSVVYGLLASEWRQRR